MDIWLFSCLHYCGLYYYKHKVAGDFPCAYLSSFGYIIRSWLAGSYSRSIFRYLSALHTDLYKTELAILPPTMELSYPFHILQRLGSVTQLLKEYQQRMCCSFRPTHLQILASFFSLYDFLSFSLNPIEKTKLIIIIHTHQFQVSTNFDPPLLK